MCLWSSLTLGVTYISDKDGSGGNTAAHVPRTGLLVKEKKQMEQMQCSVVKWAMEIISPNLSFDRHHSEIQLDLVFLFLSIITFLPLRVSVYLPGEHTRNGCGSELRASPGGGLSLQKYRSQSGSFLWHCLKSQLLEKKIPGPEVVSVLYGSTKI